jgi:squalene-hopene/tetraprenyl-beta-curcumene cyclase
MAFLTRSMRADGSWPIDTNLATWGTTLSVKALGEMEPDTREWLLRQQYHDVHPFTNAAPGGWAWTDLSGGVPDADDTAGALIALKVGRAVLSPPRSPMDAEESQQPSTTALEGPSAPPESVEAGISWLLDLQNRDGGIPTFCRGWGTLPFDRSSPELTAHTLLAWWLWQPEALQDRIISATRHALDYLRTTQRADGSWIPLWFGNEHAKDEENPVYGTAMVVGYLSGTSALAEQCGDLILRGRDYLLSQQQADGSFGGDGNAPATIEETAVAARALLGGDEHARRFARQGVDWLLSATKDGTHFPCAPIGLYFARLWYHERLYPVVWTAQALRAVRS